MTTNPTRTGNQRVGNPDTGDAASCAGAPECVDPRKARSRAKVLMGAAEILIDAGPRAVTVDAVSERSGVAKSTIYRHWDSRAAIVADVFRTHMPTVEPSTTDDFAVALDETLGEIATKLSCPAWARMMPAFMSLQMSMPEVAELNAADRVQKMRIFRRLLDLGIAEGRFSADLDQLTLLDLLLGPLVTATMGGRNDDLAHLATIVAEQFLAAHPPHSVEGTPTRHQD